MNVRMLLAAVAIAGGLALTPSTGFAQYDDKVTVCHKPGTPAQKTLAVPAAALEAHLAHGDYAGLCVTLDLAPSPSASPEASPVPDPISPAPEPSATPEPADQTQPEVPGEQPVREAQILAETGIDETAATIIGALTLATGLGLFAAGELKKRGQR